MKRFSVVLFSSIFILLVFSDGIKAQDRSFTSGSVWEISYIKTKLPHFVDYMNNLNDGWKKVMDEAKNQGIILNYMVLSSDPSNRNDWDLMLMIEYKNMAALDGLEEKMQKVQEKLFGTPEERKENAIARNDLREIIGNRTARQLVFK